MAHGTPGERRHLSDAAWYIYYSGCQNIRATHFSSISKLRAASVGFGTRQPAPAAWQGMEYRLLGAGFPLMLFNRDVQKTRSLATGGARVADSPGKRPYQADIVINMVADDTASNRIWLGHDGALRWSGCGRCSCQ